MKRSDMVIFGVALLVAVIVNPWAGLLVMLAAFAAGFGAVFSLKNLVDSKNPGGSELSVEIALLVVESLMNGNGDERQGRKLPAFSTASGGGKGSDWMGRLYNLDSFQRLCKVISLLGPVPCYPAYTVLARMV